MKQYTKGFISLLKNVRSKNPYRKLTKVPKMQTNLVDIVRHLYQDKFDCVFLFEFWQTNVHPLHPFIQIFLQNYFSSKHLL